MLSLELLLILYYSLFKRLFFSVTLSSQTPH